MKTTKETFKEDTQSKITVECEESENNPENSMIQKQHRSRSEILQVQANVITSNDPDMNTMKECI